MKTSLPLKKKVRTPPPERAKGRVAHDDDDNLSRRNLLLRMLRDFRKATLKRFKAETADIKAPLQRLTAIFDLYLKSTRERAEDYRVIHRILAECDDPEVIGALRQYYLDTEKLLTKIITEGQRAGVFRRSVEPQVGAWELIRTSLGYTATLSLNVPLYAEADYPSRAIECMLQCLLKTDV